MRIAERARSLDPAWRTALVAYAVARLGLTAWSLAIMLLFPLVVSNLDLFGVPVVAAFDLRSSERAVFSRIVGDRELHFSAAPPNIIDGETGTVWNLAGRAVSGELAGRSLSPALYSIDDVFPYRGTTPLFNPLLAPWQRFDTNWYVKIAQRGYSAEDGSTVYFPLYPILIRLLGSLLLGDDSLAAFLISNVAAIGVLFLLYQMAAELAGERVAVRSVAFLALFPTGFFLLSGYTEALFLFLALGSLREAEASRWERAGILGALAALTRLQGVVLVLPLAYLWWRTHWPSASTSGPKFPSSSPISIRGLALLFIPLATASYLLWTSVFIGNTPILTTYERQLNARFVMPWDNVAAAFTLFMSGRASVVDLFNLIVTLLFGLLMIALWRDPRMPRALALYATGMFFAPLFRMTTHQPLVSMSRYVLLIFPVFILWGMWGQSAWIRRAIVYLSFSLALYLSAQFVMWGWVA
jgi:hypothetical protein